MVAHQLYLGFEPELYLGPVFDQVFAAVDEGPVLSPRVELVEDVFGGQDAFLRAEDQPVVQVEVALAGVGVFFGVAQVLVAEGELVPPEVVWLEVSDDADELFEVDRAVSVDLGERLLRLLPGRQSARRGLEWLGGFLAP